MTEEATAPEEIPSEDETSLPESAEQSETQETEVEEPEAEAEKPKKTAKDRIDELTRARREAERDAEYWRSKALQQPEPQAPVAQKAEEAPNPDAYDAGEFDTRYIKDVARWEAKQEVAQALQAVTAQTQQQHVEREWQSRVEKVAETLPDFEEKVVQGAQRNQWACSPLAGEVLRSAEKGPEIAYHLASNPAEAARIYRLPPALQLMELGKIEASLSAPKSKTATTAPTPVPQVRGSGGKFATPADTDDFAAFDKQYGGS